MVAPETAVSNKRRTYILNVLQNLFANVQARFDDGPAMLSWTVLSTVNRSNHPCGIKRGSMTSMTKC